jgi:hypothetical protein
MRAVLRNDSVQHLGDAHPVVSVDDDGFSASDDTAIENEFDGFVDLTIKLDDRATGEIKDFAERQLTLTEAEGYVELYIEDQVEVSGGEVSQIRKEDGHCGRGQS